MDFRLWDYKLPLNWPLIEDVDMAAQKCLFIYKRGRSYWFAWVAHQVEPRKLFLILLNIIFNLNSKFELCNLNKYI